MKIDFNGRTYDTVTNSNQTIGALKRVIKKKATNTKKIIKLVMQILEQQQLNQASDKDLELLNYILNIRINKFRESDYCGIYYIRNAQHLFAGNARCLIRSTCFQSDVYLFYMNNRIIIINAPDEETAKYKLIDIMLRKSTRYGWGNVICQFLRDVISSLDTSLASYDEHQYKKFLTKQETNAGRHYGANFADDSDTEDNDFRLSQQEKTRIDKIKKQTMRTRGYKIRLRQTQETFKTLHPALKSDRRNIERKRDRDVVADVKALNKLIKSFKADEINADKLRLGIDNLNTKFICAQYRGIHYAGSHWSKKEKLAHIKHNELGKPIFSWSVLKASGIHNFGEYVAAVNNNNIEIVNKLYNNAELLRKRLIQLRNGPPVLFGKYIYSSQAHLLQHLYTSNYNDYSQYIKENLLNRESSLSNYLYNEYNPFISTSDHPFHALQYAYGEKLSYQHDKFKLKFRINSDGRVEIPYVGKLYISMHTIKDIVLEQQPLHIPTLYSDSEILARNTKVSGQIIVPERENSFPAFLPAGAVAHQHIVRFPSFKYNYKEKYLFKYGLNEEEYNLFRTALLKYQPNTAERDKIIHLLTRWLCEYNEIQLMHKAIDIAKRKGRILLYRQNDGSFSLYPASVAKPSTSTRGVREKLNNLLKDLNYKNAIMHYQTVRYNITKRNSPIKNKPRKVLLGFFNKERRQEQNKNKVLSQLQRNFNAQNP